MGSFIGELLRGRQSKSGFFAMTEAFKSVTNNDWDAGYNQFDFGQYCDKYDKYYETYPKVKSMVLTISGQVMAEGVFVVPKTKANKTTGFDMPYPRADDAVAKVNELNDDIALDELILKIALNMSKRGSCFIDKTHTPYYSVRFSPNQKHLKPVLNQQLQVTHWILEYFGSEVARWRNTEQMVLFPWDVNRNWPYGTSLLVGIDRELNTQDEIINGLKAYLKKQAFATNVLKVGDKDYEPGADTLNKITRDVKNRQPGEDFVTSYPIDLKTMGTGPVETRMIPDTLDFLNDQITDALVVPPLSKLYNSTEASAKVISAWSRAIIIYPMQRIIKRIIEKQIYWPYLEDYGFSKRVVPSLAFNPPEEFRGEEIASWVTLVEAGIATRQQAAKELGIEWKGKEKEDEKPEEEKTPEDKEEEAQEFEEYVIKRTVHTAG